MGAGVRVGIAIVTPTFLLSAWAETDSRSVAPLEASETDGVLHGGAVLRSLERDGDDRIQPSADAVVHSTRRRSRFCYIRLHAFFFFAIHVHSHHTNTQTITAMSNRAQDTGPQSLPVAFCM